MQDKIQRTLLCTWLIEIFLDQLNTLNAKDDNATTREEAMIIDDLEDFLHEYQVSCKRF